MNLAVAVDGNGSTVSHSSRKAAANVMEARDPRAVLQPLVTLHGAMLRNVAQGLCRSSSELDDLIQDTFEHALRYLAAGNPPPHNGRAWLISILRNVFIDRMRVTKTFEPIEDCVAPDAAPERTWTRYSIEDIDRVLPGLESQQRAVFELHYLRGLRYAEIASALGIPANTVASRLYRARRAVRAALLKAAPAPEER